MSNYYELVIFTAATKEYADWILDLMDDKKVLSYRLYREHTVAHNNCFLKVNSKNKLYKYVNKIIHIYLYKLKNIIFLKKLNKKFNKL